MIQRLYSSFPDSWPGAGLLFLRVAVGVPVLAQAVSASFAGPGPEGLFIRLAALCCGSLILLGLWTPVAAGVLALLQLSSGITRHYDFMQFAMALVSLSLAVLGPGAWSIDARFYGRKRIRV